MNFAESQDREIASDGNPGDRISVLMLPLDVSYGGYDISRSSLNCSPYFYLFNMYRVIAMQRPNAQATSINEVKIGFGGGCHWCTEAVFQSLRGVSMVEQGFAKSVPPDDTFSEAVVVTFTPEVIPMGILIDVHLRTHASTSLHRMRGKYRSAVYVYSDQQADIVRDHIRAIQRDFDDPIVTMTLPCAGFKSSQGRYQNYYKSNAARPFCTTYIDPKLARVRQQFSAYVIP